MLTPVGPWGTGLCNVNGMKSITQAKFYDHDITTSLKAFNVQVGFHVVLLEILKAFASSFRLIIQISAISNL